MWVGVLTLPLVYGMGTTLPRPAGSIVNSGCHPDRFWARKAHWPPHQFDIVVAGDSRVYRGVSPETVRSVLPKCRIGNFGFPSAGYNPTYLDAIEAMVDPLSSMRMIVLGITPWSLTLRAGSDNGFLEEKRRPSYEVWERLYVNPFMTFFRPVSVCDTWQKFCGQQAAVLQSRYYQGYHSDGWVASRLVPEDPGRALSAYESNFTNNPVNRKIEDDLLRTVAAWRKRGFSVFAFRPPSTALMVDLEDSRGGFHEEDFVRRLTEAGGQWLAFDAQAYHSYDGSHLDEDSARRFSRDLAQKISMQMR